MFRHRLEFVLVPRVHRERSYDKYLLSVMGESENGFHRYRHKLEKYGRGCVNWSCIRWRWDGLGCPDPHDLVVKGHHLGEEGDDRVKENDWDDEYPAHARTRLVAWSMGHYPIPETDSTWKTHRLHKQSTQIWRSSPR